MSEPSGRSKRVTLKDVAAHAGVSTAAASKVLRNAHGASDAMRDRVQRAIAELGYRPHRPARGMRGHTYTVGMVVTDIENSYFNLLSDGAASVLSRNNYELLIAPSGFSPAEQIEAMNSLIDHQMDGLILVAPIATPDELDAVARQVPIVVVGNHSEAESFDTVAGDDRVGSRLVVDHLADLGHERIAFLANDRMMDDPHRPEAVRLDGFLAAMRNRGLEDHAVILNGLWSIAGGAEAGRRLLAQSNPPTAVHAGADVAAFGMLSAWWEQGIRVPRDLSLVGYDNSRISGIGPISLTTVDQGGFRSGARAAEMLLQRIAGRAEALHELVRPHLVVRDTTGRQR